MWFLIYAEFAKDVNPDNMQKSHSYMGQLRIGLVYGHMSELLKIRGQVFSG
ncbi:hypothetical protein NBRC116593_43920 [Sulfitobacter pacificus]